MDSLGADPAQLSSYTGVRGAAARDSSWPGYFHSRVSARIQTEVGTPALAGEEVPPDPIAYSPSQDGPNSATHGGQ